MFNERKVAQMAAFLLRKGGDRMSHLELIELMKLHGIRYWQASRLHGDRMSHLKLMKLLYLADREAMGRYGAPISGDRIVAMPHGPVLSMTLNLMDGDVESSSGGWDSLISDKENHELSLKRTITNDDLYELSQADIDVLETVWKQFGRMDKWAIRDYTHDHCPEWTDPNGSSVPTLYENVFRALGRSEKVALELSARIEAERALNKIFAAL